MNALKKEVYHMERFTAKPKWWGKLRHKSRLTPAEYLVLDVIFDKTIDWNKTTDRISISQFMDELGLSNKGVINTLKSLNKKGLIFLLKQDRKTNTISIKMKAIEAYSNKPTCEVSSQDKKLTCELSSQSSELSSYQLVNSVHTHDTRDHYPIPFIYIRGYVILENYGVCKKTEQQLIKLAKENEANDLINFWNNNHGKNKSADVKPSVWLDKVKARLTKFSSDEIKLAMLSVIQSSWHQQNGQVLIKNAISSDQRCDEAISRYHQSQQTNFQGNTNANTQPANHSNQQFDTSTTAGYAAKLDADAERYYAEQARAQQSINGSTESAF